MTIAELKAKGPYVSYSQLSCWMNCSLLFFFRYVQRLEPECHFVNLALGSSIHSAIQAYLERRRAGDILSPEGMMEVFKEAYEKQEEREIRYDKLNRDEVVSLGQNMLQAFWDKYLDLDMTPVAIEQPFRIPLGDGMPDLFGIIDAIFEGKDSTTPTIITDFKTAARKKADSSLEDLQLSLYHIASKSLGYDPKRIILTQDVILKTKKPEVVRYYMNPIPERRVRKIVSAVVDGINKGVYFPNNQSFFCGTCGYSKACSDWGK